MFKIVYCQLIIVFEIEERLGIFVSGIKAIALSFELIAHFGIHKIYLSIDTIHAKNVLQQGCKEFKKCFTI